jgi:hypothetical protein
MRKSVGTLVLSLLLAAACSEPFDLAGSDSEIVVQCIIDNTERQELVLYRTLESARSNMDYINEADAYLEDITAEGKEIYFSYSRPGHYYIHGFTPVPGHQYKLTVLIEGHGPISASTTFPHQAVLEYNANAHCHIVVSESNPEARDSLYDCGPSDYITHFRIIRGSEDPTWFMDTRSSKGGDYIDTEPPMPIYLATTYPDTDTYNATGPAVGDIIQKNQDWYNKLTSNQFTLNYIIRGAGGTAIVPYPEVAETISARFLESPSHYKAIRTFLSEKFDNGMPVPEFSVAFLYYGGFTPMNSGQGFPDQYVNRMINDRNQSLYVFSVSEEYDRYLKDLMVEPNQDWLRLFNRKTIYSNIEGAAGLFGARADCELIPVKEWFGINWEEQ